MKITYITAAFGLAFGMGCAGNTAEDLAVPAAELAESEDALTGRGPVTAAGCPAAAAGFRVVACGAPLNAEVAGISVNTVFTSVQLSWDPAGPKDIYSQRFGSSTASLFVSNVVGFKVAGAATYWIDASRTTMFRRSVGATATRSLPASRTGARMFGNFDVRGSRLVFLDAGVNGNYLSTGSDLRSPALLTGYTGGFEELPYIASTGEFYGFAQEGMAQGFLRSFSAAGGASIAAGGSPQVRSNPVDDTANVYILVRGTGFQKLRVFNKSTGAIVDRATTVADAGESYNVMAMGSGRVFISRLWGFGGGVRQVLAVETSTGATSVAFDNAGSGFRMPSYLTYGVFNNTPVVSANATSGIAQSVILSAN